MQAIDHQKAYGVIDSGSTGVGGVFVMTHNKYPKVVWRNNVKNDEYRLVLTAKGAVIRPERRLANDAMGCEAWGSAQWGDWCMVLAKAYVKELGHDA